MEWSEERDRDEELKWIYVDTSKKWVRGSIIIKKKRCIGKIEKID